MPDPVFDPNAGGDGGGSSSGGSSGGSTSGGSTSTSSSGSSSSGGGSTKPDPKTQAQILAERRADRAFKELRRSYLELLRKWGIKPSKNLLNLVEKGVRGAWSSSQFLAMVRHTPEYRNRFRGIKWKTGMTEGQYLSTFAQYQARAQDIGLNLTRRDFAKLLKDGVDAEEYSERIDSLESMMRYQPMWDQFLAVLEERGIPIPKNDLDKKKELLKFIAGRGSLEWENAWQETVSTANLEQVSGINVVGSRETATGDFYEISRGDLLGIIQSVEGLTPGFNVEDITARDWAEIGKSLRSYPKSYLQRFGLTANDILKMELGAPGSAEIAERAERAKKTYEAFYEPRPVSQFTQQVGNPQEEELPQVQ